MARFAFESADDFKTDGRKIDGAVVFGQAGPRPPRERGFATDNKAALFGGGRGFIRIVDPGADSPFDFGIGDSITLEAWVNPFELQDGQQVSIVGKGRTGNPGVAADNQNWSLRISAAAGLARPSFLFRNADNRKGRSEDFHRWVGDAGFEPGSGWHHVAISYTFGVPDRSGPTGIRPVPQGISRRWWTSSATAGGISCRWRCAWGAAAAVRGRATFR